MCREKVFSAQPFKSGILEPQAIDKIEIRAKRGQRRRGASGKAGDTEVQHKGQGTDDLGLV